MQRALMKHLLCAALALGVSSEHTCAIQPGMVFRQKVPVKTSHC